jgi:hypothetical protein
MQTTTLTLVALAELAEATRKAQKAYFAGRKRRDITVTESRDLMAEAMRLEHDLDEACRRILRPRRHEPLPGGQASFFEDDGEVDL